jgi:hypothetical protein
LTETEEEVLSKGLAFGIKNKKVDCYELLARFEVLAQTMNRFEIAEKGHELKANFNSKSAFFKQLQTMSSEFNELAKWSTDDLSHEQHAAIEHLAKDKTIVVTKADKGNAVVVQNIDDYQAKVMIILNDTRKFQTPPGNKRQDYKATYDL